MQRFLFWWTTLGKRWRRFGVHFRQFCWARPQWYLEWFFLCLDLLGVPECYEGAATIFKPRTRELTPTEREMLEPLFGSDFPYHRVRIDETARLGPPQWRICYVSFCTINSFGPMTDDTLVHELVHVWQYLRHGSVYIPRALLAQRSRMGYDYGGMRALQRAVGADCGLEAFNFEQQADIIADAFRIGQGLAPRWLRPGERPDIRLYQPFLAELRVM